MNNGSFAVGIVEDRDDPLKMGRYRVRIFGVHSENLDDVPTNTLPWAIPLTMSSGVSGIGSTPTYTEGSTVFVFFQDGESKQQPIIMGAVNGFPVSTSPFAELEPLVDDKLEFVVKQDDGAVLVEPVVDNTVTDETTTKPDDIPPDPMIPQVAVFETAATEEPKVLAKPPKNPIAGLPDDFYKNIKISMGRRESSNNYRAVNKDSGFIGKYQFGAAAMTDLGYIIRGTSQSHFKKMIETAKELEEALTPEMLQMSSIDEIINAIDTASKTVATSTTPRLMSLIGTSATISETKLPDAIRTAMFSEPRYLMKNRVDTKPQYTPMFNGIIGSKTDQFYFRYEVYKPGDWASETYGFIYDKSRKVSAGGFSRKNITLNVPGNGLDWYWVNYDPNAVFSENEDDFSFGYENGYEFTHTSLAKLAAEGTIQYLMPAVTASYDPETVTDRGSGWQLPMTAIEAMLAFRLNLITRKEVKTYSTILDRILFDPSDPTRVTGTPSKDVTGSGGGGSGGSGGGSGSGEMYEFINRATDDVQTTVTTMGMARSAISVDKATRIKAVLEFNRKCWTGKDKILTIVHFFKNHPLQETCMDRYMHINEGYLKNGAGRILTSDTTAQERAGLICACHLVGHGGCTAFKGGAVRKDQSGTSAAEYYAIGVETAKGNLYGGSKQWPDTQTEGDDSTGSPEKFKSNSDIDAKNATKNNPYREPSTVPDVGVTSTEQGTKLPVWGYADPKANYPTYTKEQDYNRLGRNSNIADSIVTTKDQTLKSSVRMANAGSTWIDGKKVENGDGHWSQPPSPYNAIYPYNHVIETESGHVIELDDTPESERLHIYHRTGTFIEVDANGTKVTRVVGDNYEILDRNGFISIAGACNVNVEGTCNLSVGSTLNLEVSGDLLANVTGNIDFNTPGTFNVSADSGINLVTLSDFTNTVYGNISYTVKGKYNSRVDGTFTSVVFDKVNITSLSNFNSFVSGTSKAVVNGATTIKSGGKLNIEGGGASIIESTGDMILRSGGSIATSGAVTNFVAAGGNVKISGGTNVNVSYAVEAAPATPGPIVRWANKIFGTVAKENIFSPLATTPRNFEVMTEFDDGDVLTPEQGIERDKIMADAGVLPPAPPDAKVAEDKDAVTPEIAPSSTPVESSCDMFNSGINLNDFVSKNFKLSKLTLGRNIVAQQGLEAKELACNLKKLAENVLEKILAEYPDMIISSGLRPMGSNSKSQHPLGQAADLQFTNHKSSDYIDIAKWISKNVDTDQLILEYRTNSAQSKAGKLTTWIHVSYKGSGHRHHVFTMNNDVTVPPFGQLKLITI